jgi:hypothetical protein
MEQPLVLSPQPRQVISLSQLAVNREQEKAGAPAAKANMKAAEEKIEWLYECLSVLSVGEPTEKEEPLRIWMHRKRLVRQAMSEDTAWPDSQ